MMPSDRCVQLVIGVAFVLIAFIPLNAQESDAMTPTRVLGFARYLEDLGEYRRAATELERLLPDATMASDTLALRISNLYVLAGDLTQSERTLRNALSSTSPSSAHSLRYALASTLYRQQRFADAVSIADSITSSPTAALPAEARMRALLLGSLCSAEEQNWVAAREGALQARIIAATPTHQVVIDSLVSQIDRSSQIPMKSPFLAGLLSTIVPGLGKAYTGHPMDGLFSLISIGSFAYASYDGFSSGGSSSFRGWFFGALASGLYLGNIYGSALSASIVRDESTRQILSRLRMDFAITGIP